MDAVPDGSSVRKVSAGRILFIAAALIMICAVTVIAIDDSDDADASTYIAVDGIKYEITDNIAYVVKNTGDPYAGSITIPATVSDSGNTYPVKSIRSNAFSGCYVTSVTIGSNIVTIEGSAFAPCTELKSIVIPDNVLYFGNNVFMGCTGLESVTIGRGLETIGSGSFIGCTHLTSFDVSENNLCYSSDDNGVLFDNTKNHLTIYPIGKTDLTYTIPNSVNFIDNGAFRESTYLTYMTIPDSVTSIGTGAFFSCTKLAFLTIGDGVTTIGEGAFSQCTSLAAVDFGDSLSVIGDRAFYNCTSLTSVTTPSSMTSIGTKAFAKCTSIASVTVNGGSVGKEAFQGCTGITSVVMGSGVTSIGDSAFHMCHNIGLAVISNTVTSVGSCAFSECTAMTSLTISDNTTNIGTNAFALGISGATASCNVYGRSVNTMESYSNEYTTFTYYYTVIFKSQDGSSTLDTSTVLYNNNASYSGTTPVKESTPQYSYTFIGWNSQMGQGTVEDDVLNNITADKIVYPAFSKTERQYTVMITGEGLTVKNGDTPITSGTVVNYGTTLTLTIEDRTGYNGKIKANDTELSGSFYTVEGDVTLNGSYTGKQYLITLKANYNGGTDGSVTATYGSKLPAFTALTRTGYDLDGYFDAASGGDATISYLGTLIPNTTYADASSKWIYDGTATFYAQWTPLQYTVTIDKAEITVKNGDTPISSGTSVDYDTVLTVTIESMTGYTGKITANGEELSGSSYTVTGDVTFDGSYEAKQYTVTLKANGGKADGSVTATYDAVLPSFTALERVGYTLNGYYTAESGGDPIIGKEGTLQSNTAYSDANGKWVYDGTATFYAQWTPLQYTVTIDMNDITVKNGDVQIASGSKVDYGTVLTVSIGSKTGYTGKITANGTEMSGSSYTVTEDVTFSGSYTAEQYKITFNVNGGSQIDPIIYTVESEKIVLPSASKDGSVFDGWYDNAEFNGESISEIQKGSTGDKGLYAKWKAAEQNNTVAIIAGVVVAVVAIVGVGAFFIIRK